MSAWVCVCGHARAYIGIRDRTEGGSVEVSIFPHSEAVCLHAPTHTRCVAALSFPESPCVKETDGALFRKRMQTERRMGGRTGGRSCKADSELCWR